MVAKVFYTGITTQDTPDVFDRLLQSFPENIKEKILKYQNEHERRLRIMGKALLAYALKNIGLYPALSLKDYDYSATHQPIFKTSGFKFSISHSGNMAVCAIAEDSKTGIDIERMKPVKLDLMKFYFDKDSWLEIIHAPDAQAEFYRHWTMREAAIKASGLGLEQMELSEITPDDHTIQVRNSLYYCRMLPLRYDYTVCIASDKMFEDVELVALNIADLF